MSTTYRVYLTPRIDSTSYGDEVEITDYVLDAGVSQIRRGIDSTDYDIGAFFYDDIQIKCDNVDGYFNDTFDYRSIFKYSRDLAKIRVVFVNDDQNTITFRGLLNEEATRINASNEDIEFRILSRDSVIRNTNVSSGTISNGSLVSSAISAILNVPAITSVLNFDPLNINPANDIIIDVGAELENKNTRDTLNQLLLASNSVMVIDDSDNIIVRSRDQDQGSDILYLYGPYDFKRRQNIIEIQNYNSGKHRMFTAVKINETEESNVGYIQQYGYKQKKVSMPFITDPATESLIATNLLDEFKAPKIELEVTCPTKDLIGVGVLSKVSIDYPLRTEHAEGKFFPIIGVSEIGDPDTPLPYVYGSTALAPQMGFKIIEIKEDPKSFETTLKLRQIGNDTGDGYFTSDPCGVIGFATIGVSEICSEGDIADGFNPSVIGAAIIGYTELVA